MQHRAPYHALAKSESTKLWSFCISFCTVVLVFCLAFASLGYTAAPDNIAPQPTIWHEIDQGLNMATFDLSTTPSGQVHTSISHALSSRSSALVVMRIDPTYWQFSVHCASANNDTSLPIRQWAEQEDLTLAINASMYLPDGITSTGYLQDHGHLNNPRIGSKLGAFFVANPTSSNLPLTALLDKTTHPYESLIPNYNVVVQNFRLISPDRHILWNAGGARHSIAAIGQDAQGRILFLHCAKPMTPHEFAAVLLALPLNIRNTMYVEGGPESALLLRTPELTKVWIGKLRPELLGFGSSNVPLPNIIGVQRR